MRTLTIQEARRLAVLGSGLAGERQTTVLDVARRLGRIQLDPTVIVDRAERLTVFTRLGAFDRDDLRRPVEGRPPTRFEYEAHLYPVEDLALHRPRMRRFPVLGTNRGDYTAGWLEANAAFRAYVLDELDRRGPLPGTELEDRAAVPWSTGGWNDGKNVGRMLEILQRMGVIAIARREGAVRWWDRFERVVPVTDVPDLSDLEVARALIERQLRARGVIRRGKAGPLDYGEPERPAGEAALIADGTAVPVDIDGVKGAWLAHADGLRELDAGAWSPRTTMLGPFDPLIHDRARTLELFAFDYAFEMYHPAATRRYGPYTLAVLDGERPIGRLDAFHDRARGTFVVRGIWTENEAPLTARASIDAAIAELAAWLDAPVRSST